MVDAMRVVWDEPRAPDAPRRVWRDWALVGVFGPIAVLEGLLRPDLPMRALSVLVVLAGVVAVVPWRRRQPLAAVAVAFGATGLLPLLAGHAMDNGAAVAVLLLVYALTRWGSGREIVLGTAVIAVKAGVLDQLVQVKPSDTVAGLAVLSSCLALGLALRYRAGARRREIDRIRLLERERLARDLHDTVAHHVSAMAIRAQAGIATAATDPDAALSALHLIEAEASQALTEMRAMVRLLRHAGPADPPELSPTPSFADLAYLADPAAVPTNAQPATTRTDNTQPTKTPAAESPTNETPTNETPANETPANETRDDKARADGMWAEGTRTSETQTDGARSDHSPPDDARANDLRVSDLRVSTPRTSNPHTSDPRTDSTQTHEAHAGETPVDGTRAEGTQTGQAQTDGARSDHSPPDDARADNLRISDPRTSNPQTSDPQTGDPRTDSTRVDGARVDGARSGDPQTYDPRTHDTRTVSTRSGDTRTDGTPASWARIGDPQADGARTGKARTGPRVDVELSGDLDGIPAPVGAAIYRLAQESVTNARRHARHATRIEVRVHADDTSVRLRVTDDGDSGSARPATAHGYGLIGMTERATLLGGTCEAGPTHLDGTGRGWTVTAVLPRSGATAPSRPGRPEPGTTRSPEAPQPLGPAPSPGPTPSTKTPPAEHLPTAPPSSEGPRSDPPRPETPRVEPLHLERPSADPPRFEKSGAEASGFRRPVSEIPDTLPSQVGSPCTEGTGPHQPACTATKALASDREPASDAAHTEASSGRSRSETLRSEGSRSGVEVRRSGVVG
ncbi:histidine kinase [Dactylosporangium sp. NPDC006015]|uniref:histidine kinase n=1 Tax=Dactylosporangium sp. NPDC006015 TaxID=3154576 RepID=UPI0033AD5158